MEWTLVFDKLVVRCLTGCGVRKCMAGSWEYDLAGACCGDISEDIIFGMDLLGITGGCWCG